MTKVGNISLSTNDLEANRAFYVDWLGLPVRGDHGQMLVLEGHLVIDAAHGNPPTTGAHVMLVADDLDGLVARASERDITCKRTPWGTLSTTDPDGRMVEVMAAEKWAELGGD